MTGVALLLFLIFAILGMDLYVIMAYVVMAYIGMAYIGMAYIVMAYVVMAHTGTRASSATGL